VQERTNFSFNPYSYQLPSITPVMSDNKYHLLYWPVCGRGEFVRLALEEGAADYVDNPNGINEILEIFKGELDTGDCPAPLAVPALRYRDLIISQSSNILLFLGPRLGLVPEQENAQYFVNQLALTAMDIANEAHNTHHPVSVNLYYEDQKPEAARAAQDFREARIPKFFNYFNGILKKNKAGSDWLYGNSLTYADLVLFESVHGVLFGFPKAAQKVLDGLPLLKAHHERVKSRPRVKAYLESERRKPYGEGVFRHYPQHDEQ